MSSPRCCSCCCCCSSLLTRKKNPRILMQFLLCIIVTIHHLVKSSSTAPRLVSRFGVPRGDSNDKTFRNTNINGSGSPTTNPTSAGGVSASPSLMSLPSKDLLEEDLKALDDLIFGATNVSPSIMTTSQDSNIMIQEKDDTNEDDDDKDGGLFDLEELLAAPSKSDLWWQDDHDHDDSLDMMDPEKESIVDHHPLDFGIRQEDDPLLDPTTSMFGGLHDNEQDNTSSSSFYPSSHSIPPPSPQSRMDDERGLTPSKATVKEFALSMLYASSESLKHVITGKVAGHVPADMYGETLDQEIAACQLQAEAVPVPYTDLEIESLSILESSTNLLPGDSITTHRKLYGGAQYHRTLRNFHHRIMSVPIPPASQDEISLLVHGIASNVHDGTDLLRTVAKLSCKRMEYVADYLLKEMAQRVEYVLDRMWCVVEYTLLTRNGPSFHLPTKSSSSSKNRQLTPMQYELLEQDLQTFLRASYRTFVQTQVSIAYQMAREDIFALLRFVSWDLAFANERSTPQKAGNSTIKKESGAIHSNSNVDFDPYDGDDANDDSDKGDLVGGVLSRGDVPYASATVYDKSKTDDILNLVMQSVKAAAPSADNTFAPTCAAINTLVQHVTNRWRLDISNIVMSKFNAFCLLPFHDEFTSFLRDEIAEYLSEQSF